MLNEHRSAKINDHYTNLRYCALNELSV